MLSILFSLQMQNHIYEYVLPEFLLQSGMPNTVSLQSVHVPIEPERFYHGFVLGLVVDLAADYVITSNRESGRGRYDVMIEPKDTKNGEAFILEFKVCEKEDGDSMEDTVRLPI